MTHTTITRTLLAWLVAGAMLLTAALAFAADRIHLADGRVLEGEVLRELDGHIWFRHRINGIQTEQVFAPHDYTRIEREAVPERPAERGSDRARPAEAPAQRPRDPGTPRAAIVTLGDHENNMVGLYITRSILRDITPLLEEEEIDILVLRINSGGGLLLEVPRLTDYIHDELKPRFRVVAWIESAISAAAMTAHVIEEIYFMPQGNYGGATGFNGGTGKAIDGAMLAQTLFMMERVSEKGGYPIEIMRSMQIDEPLSVSFNARGEAVWSQDEGGQYLVNPRGRILTLNSQDAERFQFSKGTATTPNDLARAMGLQEVIWVGEQVRGVPFPVSKAENAMRAFRDRTARNARFLNAKVIQYSEAINTAAGMQDRDRRLRFLGIAERALNELVSTIADNTGHMLFTLGQPTEEDYRQWIRDQQEQIRELRRR